MAGYLGLFSAVIILTLSFRLIESQNGNSGYMQMLQNVQRLRNIHDKFDQETDIFKTFSYIQDIAENLPTMTVETLEEMLENINSETLPSSVLDGELDLNSPEMVTLLKNMREMLSQIEDETLTQLLQEAEKYVHNTHNEIGDKERYKRSVKENATTQNQPLTPTHQSLSAATTASPSNFLSNIFNGLFGIVETNATSSPNTNGNLLSTIMGNFGKLIGENTNIGTANRQNLSTSDNNATTSPITDGNPLGSITSLLNNIGKLFGQNTTTNTASQSSVQNQDNGQNQNNEQTPAFITSLLNNLVKSNPMLAPLLPSITKGLDANTISSLFKIVQQNPDLLKTFQGMLSGPGGKAIIDMISKYTDNPDINGLLASLGQSNNANGIGLSSNLIGNLLNIFNGKGSTSMGDILSLIQGIMSSKPGNMVNVSKECAADIKLIMDGLDLSNPKPWALRMADALGKPDSGIMDGGIKWWGAYDECLRVGNDDDQKAPFKGKYCLGTLKIPPATLASMGSGILAYIGGPSIGLCMPDTCSSDDTQHAWNSVFSKLSLSLEVECQEPKEYDTKAIVALTICGFFLAMLLFATIFDVFFVEPDRKKAKAQESKSQRNGNVQTTETNVDMSNGHQSGVNDITKNGGNLNGGFVHEMESGEKSGSVDISDIAEKPVSVMDNHYNVMTDKVPENITAKPKTSAYNPGRMTKVFLSFSIYTNTKKMMNTKQPAGALSAVNGIRFISMTWVILGHVVGFAAGVMNNVGFAYAEYLKRFSFMAIANAEVSVDTFFTLSGLLLAYLFLKEMKREKGRVNWFMFYFHRFWRLTPVYMLVMMIDITLSRYFYNGPAYPKPGFEPDLCEDNWWHNLLYVNNFFTKECMAWSWYLANDMQFYVVSPLILVPLYFSDKIGKIVVGIFLVGMTISSITVSAVLELPSTMSSVVPVDTADYFSYYYVRPYCRMGPYIVGIITGYTLYKTQCKVKISKVVNIFTWVVAFLMACIVLYGTFEASKGNRMTVAMAAIYNGTSRTIWGACVCWVIFSCCTGHGGIINQFLSWKAFIPLGRLTYCAYLVHPMVIYAYIGGLRNGISWNDVYYTYDFLATLVISYGFAFITSLAFEAPMMGLEKAILRRK